MANSKKTPDTIKNTLSYLRKRAVLSHSKMGMRKIISAQPNIVECQGLDLPFYKNEEKDGVRLENFHPGSIVCAAWVDYEGRRARMTVTLGHPEWINTACDISSHFPVNKLASELLQQPSTKWSQYNPDHLTVYGDSVLITDVRSRWVMRCHGMEHNNFDIVDEILTTPRTTYRSDFACNSAIYFHETPNEDDLLYLKMRS